MYTSNQIATARRLFINGGAAMEAISALIVTIVAVVALAGFDLAALGWGADSRPELADDHQR